MQQTHKTVRDLVTTGSKAASWAATYIETAHGEAQKMMGKAAEQIKAGQTFQQFNSGGFLTLTQEEKDLINWGKKESGKNAAQYAQKTKQAEKFVSKVPDWVKKAAIANPGEIAKDSKYLKWAAPALKKLPYVGTTLSVGQSVFDVASGQKSVGDAAAHFAASTAGGAAGGALGGAAVGAIAGSEVPVAGTIIGGTVGAILGSEAGDKMVDFIQENGPHAQAIERHNAELGGITSTSNPYS